ncbi:MAG: hypothetical protein CMI30_06090 [Opitutae bacterium]|nr:hypothetical protein [Opitutae bacterium]
MKGDYPSNHAIFSRYGLFACCLVFLISIASPMRDVVAEKAKPDVDRENFEFVQVEPPVPDLFRINALQAKNRQGLVNDLNQPKAPSLDDLRPDRLEFFDGSMLRGELMGLQARKNLSWQHPASTGPASFQYAAIASISFEGRPLPENKPSNLKGMRCLLHFRNGDSCYGTLVNMNRDSIDLDTSFAGQVKASRKKIESLLALPESHQTLYDLSQGLKNWKLPNGNAWKLERGELLSVSTGSIGRKFPRKENVALDFEVHWNRTFYFNVRIFAENPESSSYTNAAYNLSFSSNRITLTASKTKSGRVVRETIGSATLNQFHQKKNARILFTANRKKKIFSIWVDGVRVERWQDPDTSDASRKGDAILLYNQGGSSQIRIPKLSITGWDGDFEPVSTKSSNANETSVTFVNGDTTKAELDSIQEGKISIRSNVGNFEVPLDRIRRISFANDENADSGITTDHAWLARGTGNLSLSIKSLAEGKFTAVSPVFGELVIDQEWLRRIDCNRHLIELEEYLSKLRAAKRAIGIRNFDAAREALLSTRPNYRGWQWGRLFFHLQSQDSEELQRYAGHESGMEGAFFSSDGNQIISGGYDGGYRILNTENSNIIKEQAGLDVGYPRPELGRYPNETQRQVHLSRDFWMSKFEITQGQYMAVMGENPSANAIDPNLPVENVSWNEAVEFCSKLSLKYPPPKGYTYRLPTTAEWEFACRAGSNGPYAGTKEGQLRQAADYLETLDKLGWFVNNSTSTQPVGKKMPNALGLHDMHGNVWEWCLDHAELNKGRMAESYHPGVTDPLWNEGEWRTLRGGCYRVTYERCRSSYRGANAPIVKDGNKGFRIVLGPDLKTEQGLIAEDGEAPVKAKLEATEKRTIDEPSITLLPISAGSFIMGSPGSLRSQRVALSQNDQFLAHVNIVGALEVQNLENDSLVSATAKLPSPATAIDLSADGKIALTGSHDGLARLWDAQNGRLLHTCKGHTAKIASVAFSPDGQKFATGGIDGSCRIWETATAKEILVIKEPTARFLRLSFSPDGKRLLTSGPGSAPVIWDCKSGQRIVTMQVDPEKVTAARFSPSGKYAAVTMLSNRINLCETTSGVPINFIRQSSGAITDLAFSFDGTKLLTVNLDKVIRSHHVPLGWSVIIFDKKGTKSNNPDLFFSITAASNSSDQSSSAYIERWIEKQEQQGANPPIVHSKDDKWSLTHSDGALRLWRTETGSLHAILANEFHSPIAQTAFSPDDRIVLAQLSTGEILAYPSMNWNSIQPEEEWEQLIQTLDTLDAKQARAWLSDSLPEKP